jgi:hypothetical protein
VLKMRELPDEKRKKGIKNEELSIGITAKENK